MRKLGRALAVTACLLATTTLALTGCEEIKPIEATAIEAGDGSVLLFEFLDKRYYAPIKSTHVITFYNGELDNRLIVTDIYGNAFPLIYRSAENARKVQDILTKGGSINLKNCIHEDSDSEYSRIVGEIEIADPKLKDTRKRIEGDERVIETLSPTCTFDQYEITPICSANNFASTYEPGAYRKIEETTLSLNTDPEDRYERRNIGEERLLVHFVGKSRNCLKDAKVISTERIPLSAQEIAERDARLKALEEARPRQFRGDRTGIHCLKLNECATGSYCDGWNLPQGGVCVYGCRNDADCGTPGARCAGKGDFKVGRCVGGGG